jgi:hypothetical protein
LRSAAPLSRPDFSCERARPEGLPISDFEPLVCPEELSQSSDFYSGGFAILPWNARTTDELSLASVLLESGLEIIADMPVTELSSPDLQVVCLADSIIDPYEDSERRGDMRLSMDDVSWLRSARLKYGPDVRVIDISRRGILVETEGQPLRQDANIVFELSGPMSAILVPSKVLRCRAASFDEVMRYQGACAFKRPLEIPDLVKRAVAKGAAPTASVVAPSAAAWSGAALKSSANVSWQKVVARFRDGRLVRGYTADFHPSRPQLHLSAEPHGGDTLMLQLSQLKALFFVRDFAGDQNRVDRQDFGEALQGRKVAVIFHDGETLLGSTLSYRGEGNGFFVHPADPRSNNLRVFIAPGSTQQVRFL